MRSEPVVLVVAITLLAGGCGDDDEPEQAGTGGSSAATQPRRAFGDSEPLQRLGECVQENGLTNRCAEPYDDCATQSGVSARGAAVSCVGVLREAVDAPPRDPEALERCKRLAQRRAEADRGNYTAAAVAECEEQFG